eukprot:403371925
MHKTKNVIIHADIKEVSQYGKFNLNKVKRSYNEVVKDKKSKYEPFVVDEFEFSDLSIPIVFKESRLIILEVTYDEYADNDVKDNDDEDDDDEYNDEIDIEDSEDNDQKELIGFIYDVEIEKLRELSFVKLIMRPYRLRFNKIREYTPFIWQDYIVILFGIKGGSYFQIQKLSLSKIYSESFSLTLWIEDDKNQQFLVDYPNDFSIRSPLIFKDNVTNKWYMVCKVFGSKQNPHFIYINSQKYENIGHVFEIRIEDSPVLGTPQRFIMKTLPEMKYFGIKTIKDDEKTLEQFTFNQRLNQTCYDEETKIWFLVDMTTTIYILDLHNKVFSQGSTMKDLQI